MDHLRALVELAGRARARDVLIHAFTDGRDTLPHSGAGYLAEVEAWEGARVASVTGRYYAMDRDRRWERTKLAWDALVHGEAEHSSESAESAVRAAYERGETDEFIKPTLVGEEGRIRDGDSVVFFNFRPDRARQLTRALGEHDFAEFDRGHAPRVTLATLTRYHEDWHDYPVAFPPARPAVTLAATLAGRGIRQLHVAETEKYAHVTYFFNGGEEDEFDGEVHRLVDSPRDVPTYDHKPEMSAREAAAAFVESWAEGDFGFGIINFANPDMVGHTGVIPAAVKAIETVDECLGRVVDAVHASGGGCLITADHGNADQMLEPDGSPNTAHSMNPVPVVVTADVGELREGGILADVAPTILALLGQPLPEAMTGKNLTRTH
jgi:2,3-bisphosphoglycerate-independent phosphoglycerate mutase